MMGRNRKIVAITAGSEYGRRRARYQVIAGVLVLREDSGPDGLVGNSVAGEFAGLTLAEAQDVARAANAERLSDHDYCGCHACNFSVHIRKQWGICALPVLPNQEVKRG